MLSSCLCWRSVANGLRAYGAVRLVRGLLSFRDHELTGQGPIGLNGTFRICCCCRFVANQDFKRDYRISRTFALQQGGLILVAQGSRGPKLNLYGIKPISTSRAFLPRTCVFQPIRSTIRFVPFPQMNFIPHPEL